MNNSNPNPNLLVLKNLNFSPTDDKKEEKRYFLSNNMISSIDKSSFRRNQVLNPVWKSNGLIILLYIKKFLENLKKISTIFTFRRMTQKQFQFIGDQSIDFEYYDRTILVKNLSVQQKITNSKFVRKLGHISDKIYESILINPQTPQQLAWDFIVLVILVINLLYLPLKISFNISEQRNINSDENSDTRNRIPSEMVPLFNEIPAIIFTIDLLICFVTTFYFQGFLIRNKQRIAINYIKTDFMWDLIGILNFIFQSQLDNRYTELIFIVRIAQLQRILNNFEENLILQDVKAAIKDFTKLIITIMFVAHYSGCMFFYIHTIERDRGVEKTWVSQLGFNQLTWPEQYLNSLYWGVVTMITVGYGDITPVTPLEKFVVIGLTLVSCGVFAYAVIQIGNIFEEIRQRDKSYQKQFSSINQYLKNRGLSHQLLMQVQRYCQYLHIENADNLENSQKFINTQLNPTLCKEVRTDINIKILEKHKIFKLIFSKKFNLELAPKLYIQLLGPQQQLLIPNQPNNKLFFILSGEAWVYLPISGGKIQKIERQEANDLIGVHSFFSQENSHVGIIARDAMRVMVLQFESFNKIIKNHKEEYQKFCQIRDDLNFLGRSQGLDIQCQACDSFQHCVQFCPLIHYATDQEQQIFRQLNQEQVNRRKPFKRINYSRRLFFNRSITNSTNYAKRAIDLLLDQGIKLDLEDDVIMNSVQNIRQANNITDLFQANTKYSLMEQMKFDQKELDKTKQDSLQKNESQNTLLLIEDPSLEINQQNYKSNEIQGIQNQIKILHENITQVGNSNLQSQQIQMSPEQIKRKKMVLTKIQNYRSFKDLKKPSPQNLIKINDKFQ